MGAKAVLARFGAYPVSGGPNQPFDAADVRRRAVLLGVSNEFAVCMHCCVRKTALVRCGRCALCLSGRANPPVATSLSEHEERRGCNADRHKLICFRSISRIRSPPLTGGPRARHRRRERFPMEDRRLNVVRNCASSSSLEVAGSLRSSGT